ncbi:hypothetical protein ABZ951_27970, partial [Streptomyces sp. NPDC046215]|uniref:hypothetical protein n=1 Tax=Streptomyces sp. NPDC046215 TaxID=3155774 RepID=UPI0033CD54A4
AQWGGARVERKLKVDEAPEKRRNQITAGRRPHTPRPIAVMFGEGGTGCQWGSLDSGGDEQPL